MLTEADKKKYRETLDAIITAVKTRQVETREHMVESENFILELTKLKDLLIDVLTQKQWFDEYLRVYIASFRSGKIYAYSEPNRVAYEALWGALSLVDKIAVAKMSDAMYEVPNVFGLTVENFEIRAKKRVETAFTPWLNGLEKYYAKIDNPLFGGKEHCFSIKKDQEVHFSLRVWVYPAVVRVYVDNKGLDQEIATQIDRAFFHTLFEL